MKELLQLPTLKARLVFWFTTICLVPLAVMTTLIYFQRVKVATELVLDKLSAVSSLRQDQINTSLDHLIKDASTLASARSVLTAASAPAPAPGRELEGDAASALVLLRGYRDNFDSVAEISVVSRSGTVLVSTSAGSHGGATGKSEMVRAALRDLAPVFGEVYLSGSDGVPSMDLAVPITSDDSKSPPAVILVRYDLRNFLKPFVQNRTGMGRTGETVLINRDAVALNDLRELPGSALKVKLHEQPALLAAQGRSGVAETRDLLDEKVMAAYAYIPRTGWGLICKQHAAEVFAPLTGVLYLTYLLAAVTSLLVCGFAYRLARSISQPLINLAQAATQLGAGGYATRIAPEGTEEQRMLGSCFNAMADALQLKMDAQHGLALISESLVRAEDLADYFKRLLPVCLQVTEARMAVAFVEESGGEHFVPVRSIGADSTQMRSFSRQGLEGELGIVLNAGSVSRFSAAESGQALRFITSFGEVLPAEIVTVPVTVDDQIRAFISLASEKPLPPKAYETLDQVRALLSASYARVLAGEDVRRLASELVAKNAELTQQSEELVQQSAELALQSDELSRRNLELDQQKQQLEVATRLKSQFLSNMSHELRTPLNSVLALSRVLAVHGAERLSEEERGYLDIIERNGRHLLSLINDILDLAKIESGRQELFYESVAPEAVAAEVVDSFAVIARDKGIKLALAPQGPLPPVLTDVKRLRQILHNLVGNAVKFTALGSVTVRLRAEGRRFLVEVEDTGIGIAPEQHEVIFQEFRQADGSTSRIFEGTGLGLAIVKKTALLLGGDVTVRGALGQGATFTLCLPLDSRMQGGRSRLAAAPAPLLQASARVPENRTVLVVDGDPEAAALIAGHLENAGYRTVSAASGAEALGLARADKPFAITLDLMMPELDGLAVMQQLKAQPETAEVPIIMVSLSRDHQTGLALGAIGIITKPVGREQLIEQVAQLAGTGCRLVLVVDEDGENRCSIAALFKQSGMDVLLAESGAQALELAVTDPPDLIALEPVLPGEDGAALLEKLRECQATAAIPVVIITSRELTREELARLSLCGSSPLAGAGVERALVLDQLLQSLERLGGAAKQHSSRQCSRILIVEDSEAATIQLRFALESAGFSVDAVSGGRHAMSYLRTHLPDGIILDLMMPEVDGFEVLQAVRSSALTEQVPVMVMTAKTLSPGEYHRLRELGVSHLVQKGDVDLQDLLGRVYEMLGVVRIFREPQPAPEPAAAPVPSDWQGDGSLLVVEDNPDNMATLKAVLGGKYRLVEAVDGEAGLLALKGCSPSLILLDMQLPHMDGMTVLKRLKEDPDTSAIPVVALTASAMTGDREKLLRGGCADYLSKPYQVEELLQLVQRFVAAKE